MTLVLNLLWLICGGFVSGCLWLVGGAILALTVVGLPWTFAAWRIAGFVFWPFGREVVDRRAVTGVDDWSTGVLGLALNIVWILLAGWYIALSHLVMAIFEAVTLIGLPFAFKDLQIAGLALMPAGRMVVDKRWRPGTLAPPAR